MKRLGVFGGTFDPPHVGHLALAEWAREALRLDRILFVPAGLPPHKRRTDLSSAADRLALTRAAVRGNPAFEVSSIEARRGGPSYTLDTLRTLRARHAGARLFLLIGADSLADFENWREPDAIAAIATLAVALRPGAARPAVRRARRIEWLDNPGLEVSSSAVRARVRAGRSVRYLVPDAVARLIEQRGLYRAVGPRRGVGSGPRAPKRQGGA
jgi:nicotinate-nucleotide adenylyltransferase